MTAQHHGPEVTLDHWFQPILLPAEAYVDYVRQLNDALRELEEQHDAQPDFPTGRFDAAQRPEL